MRAAFVVKTQNRHKDTGNYLVLPSSAFYLLSPLSRAYRPQYSSVSLFYVTCCSFSFLLFPLRLQFNFMLQSANYFLPLTLKSVTRPRGRNDHLCFRTLVNPSTRFAFPKTVVLHIAGRTWRLLSPPEELLGNHFAVWFWSWAVGIGCQSSLWTQYNGWALHKAILDSLYFIDEHIRMIICTCIYIVCYHIVLNEQKYLKIFKI